MLASALVNGEITGVAHAMRNVFEDVILPQIPGIAGLKRALESGGAIGAQLSGSGSTVFGIVPSRAEALDVAAGLSTVDAEIQVVRTFERGVIVARRS